MARGPKSSVRKLPPEILDELHRLLGEGRLTYDELHAWLHAKGGDVSRSALHRYGADFDKVAAALRQKREIARAMVQELGSEADLSPILIEQLHTILFRLQSGALGEEGQKFDSKDLMMLASAVKSLTGASRDINKLRAEIRTQVAKEAAERADAIGKAEGLSAATLEKMKREFLGLATA